METDQLSVIVAKEFSMTPGPRYRSEGDFSGQQFREDLLRPRFIKALETNKKLFVDLDGTEGYLTSFLEEAFGGLAREFGEDVVESRLQFKSLDDPLAVEEILEYIKDAGKPRM